MKSKPKFTGPLGGGSYAQPITHFCCRPCGEYHLITHPHYRLMLKRRAENRRRKLAGLPALPHRKLTLP